MNTRNLLTFVLVGTFLLVSGSASAEKSWLYPTFSMIREYDDNVFLSGDDPKTDLITTVVPGIAFEPKLNDHEFKINYKHRWEFFDRFDQENNGAHIGQMASTLNFTDFKIDINEFFIHAEDRSGAEDTARVPRTSNNMDLKYTHFFNKLDVGFKFETKMEHYRTNDPISAYQGRSMTYKNLNSDDHSGELEFALKLWPKTALLASYRAGIFTYIKDGKGDSRYFDGLIGLKGNLTAKTIIEGKVGYRRQNYEDFHDDYGGAIGLGNMLTSFDDSNTLQLSYERTTNPTNYTNNNYYISSFVFSEYAHNFTKRFRGKINTSYQFNEYPIETTVNGKTASREDHLMIGGIGLSYELVRMGTLNLDYTHSEKISEFETFEYKDNRVRLGFVLDF